MSGPPPQEKQASKFEIKLELHPVYLAKGSLPEPGK